jgi:hypothetical protein
MLNVKKGLYNDIKLYCEANDITDIDLFCNKLLEKAFLTEKYGDKPGIVIKKEVKVEEKVVYNPENILPLPEPKVEEIRVEEKPKKEPKKVNLNDDYTVYDNI